LIRAINNKVFIYMENLNLGFLLSSVIATTGLGAYVLYMNNTDNNNDNDNTSEDNISNEYRDDDNNEPVKKSVTIKTKRRNNKSLGTRRRRY